jgi:hypothetical protein
VPITTVLFRVNPRFDDVGHVRQCKIQNGRAQSLAVGVERKRARNAAAERIGHDEIQRTDHWQLKARHLAAHDPGEVGLDAIGRHLLPQKVVMRLVEGDDGDVRRVAFVAGPGASNFAELHDTAFGSSISAYRRAQSVERDSGAPACTRSLRHRWGCPCR